MSAETITVLMLVTLLSVILLGYPISLTLAGLGGFFGLVFLGPKVASMLVLRTFEVYSNYIFLAVPLFIFMGVVIERTKLASNLYNTMHVLLKRLKGGLAIATIITCTLFAAATGVIAASVVTMGLFALPSMLQHRYDKSLATGSICAGGALGILIPPSVMIVLYGPMASLSVGRLFMGAFIPGLILSLLYIVYIFIRCQLNPGLAPDVVDENEVPLGKKLLMFSKSVLPVLGLILGVLGLIAFGVTAPTEAAAIGAFLSLVLALAYKTLTWKNIKECLFGTVKITSMVYLVCLGANFFTGVFLRLGGGDVVKDAVASLPFAPWVILLLMFGIVFLLGMFIDWIGIIMIVVPLFTPIAANLGYDAVWFAMMVMIVMQTSFLTPPFAYSIFFLKGVAPPEVTTLDIYKGVWPFILLQIAAIILFIVFPKIILWLPNIVYGS